MEVLWNLFDNTIVFIAMISLSIMWPLKANREGLKYKVIMGIVLSAMSLFVMVNSVHVGNGLYIDARYAIPVIAVLFFGIIPGSFVVVTIILVRIYLLGGAGAPIGVLFALIQFITIYIYKIKYYDIKQDTVLRASMKLFFISFALQLVLISLPFLFLDTEIALSAIRANALYLVTIYPLLVFLFSYVVGKRYEYYYKIEDGIIRDKFFETILRQSPSPIAIIDSKGNFLQVNETWKELVGDYDFDVKNCNEWFESVIVNKKTYLFTVEGLVDTSSTIDYHIQTKHNGVRVWNVETKEAGSTKDGEVFFVVIATDITSRKKYEKKLINISYHDFLTGLYNRRFYNEVFKLDRLQDEDIHIIYGDMNNLKSVNDYYGHSKGDKAIQVCTEVLTKHFSGDSTLFRFGGDEFLIVTEGTKKQECIKRIEEVSKELKTFNFGKVKIGISLGIHKLELNQTLDEAVMKAESRMYEYKIFESSSARSGTVDVILTMLFEKDSETEKHSKRVQAICREFIQVLDLNTSETSLILRAALLHDIGKILIPTTIILSKEKLSDQEFDIIKNHSYLGYRILSSKEQLKDIGDIVLTHHERFDGKGYPNNLKGEEIPYTARILNIADAYEAMTSVRPYSKKMTDEEAIEELRNCSGTQFDSRLVEKFIPIIPKLPKQ